MSKIRTSKIIKGFGQWAVTVYGIECTRDYAYSIPKERLAEDWWSHMTVKAWVEGLSFNNALRYARESWNIKQSQFYSPPV